MKPRPSTTWLRATVVFAIVALPLATLNGKSAESRYGGFTIDETQLRNPADVEQMRKAVQEQIDMVLAVGLPAEILDFFRSVPFVLILSNGSPRITPGLYRKEDRSVRITSRIVTIGRRPVLLHELLHAFHDQKMPQGFKNADIVKHFEKGKATGAYAPRSHMMQNQGEFFACAATTYLFGVTAQEPFNRERLKNAQPEILPYFKELFGSDAGNYEGR